MRIVHRTLAILAILFGLYVGLTGALMTEPTPKRKQP